MSPVQILLCARALLHGEECLAVGAYARDARGKECAIDSPKAVAWSPAGALVRARGESRTREGLAAQRLLNAAGLRDSETSYTAIIAAFDRAITSARAASTTAPSPTRNTVRTEPSPAATTRRQQLELFDWVAS